MEFSDIEDGYPEKQAMYSVLIVDADTGDQREAKADFKLKSGNFMPIADTLRGSEYVKGWKPIDPHDNKSIEGPDRYFDSDGH